MVLGVMGNGMCIISDSRVGCALLVTAEFIPTLNMETRRLSFSA